MRIRICGKYPPGTEDRFRDALTAHDLRFYGNPDDLLSLCDAECIVVRQGLVTEEVIGRNPDLRGIIRWGAGYDSVDIRAAGKNGVEVANLPGANAHAVAELASAFILLLNRQIMGYWSSCRAGNWSTAPFENTARTLRQKTVGIIGAGNIGRMLASRVQAFGAQTIYYDVVHLDQEREQANHLTYADLDELLRLSDVISIHLPLLPETFHMIGSKQIARMKPGAALVNTARGGLVDDAALLDALRSGKLSGAALDCVEDEHSPVTAQLFETPNVIITPHIGGTASDLVDVMVPMVVDEIGRLSGGQSMLHVVNREFLTARPG